MLISLNNTKVKRWGDASAREINQLVCVVYLSFQSWLLKFTHTGKPLDIYQNINIYDPSTLEKNHTGLDQHQGE